MPFTGIGFGEMLVIGMLILIVFGPRRLPEISRSMGKAIREFKRGMNEIQRELDVADREARWNEGGRQKGSGTPPAASRAGVPGGQPTIAPPATGPGEEPRPAEAPASAGTPEGETERASASGSEEKSESESADPVAGEGR